LRVRSLPCWRAQRLPGAFSSRPRADAIHTFEIAARAPAGRVADFTGKTFLIAEDFMFNEPDRPTARWRFLVK